jgi:catechol 2,3-dioxygenase-like lactoylglutathione lyase family enzyme
MVNGYAPAPSVPVVLDDTLRGRWIFDQRSGRSHRARHELAAAIGTDAGKHGVGAMGTKSAFEAANARVGRRRKIAVAIFAIGAKLEHGLSCNNAGQVARGKRGPVAVTGIDHVQLAMPAGGEADARAFYTGMLGIPEIPKPAHLRARGGCWFETPTVKVHLGVEPDFRPARKAHPGLVVDDLPQLIAALTAANVVVTADSDNAGHVYVDDPFGNRIELMEKERASGGQA